MEFTKEQLQYIQHANITENIFLNACPGSGKTETIAQRVANEIESWKSSAQGIAVLSFTKSAAKELEHRIKTKLKDGTIFPHFVGTFDSFILKNIVNPLAKDISDYQGDRGDYSFKIVNYESNLYFHTKYSYAKQKISGHHVEIDARNNKLKFHTPDQGRNRLLNSMSFLEWQVDDIYNAKNKCLNAGFITHNDISYLAEAALTRYEETKDYAKKLALKYQLIIIDECQDLSFEQLTILKAMLVNGSKLHFVGDLNQAIYDFRDVDPNDIVQFISNNDFTEIKLTKNFRSCQKIVNIATTIMDSSPIEANFENEESSCLILQYNHSPAEVMKRFHQLTEKYKNRVIVARGHQLLMGLSTVNSTPNSSTEYLLSSVLNFDEKDYSKINQSLIYLSKFLKNKIKIETTSSEFNCPQVINSELKWKIFLYKILIHLRVNGLNEDCNWSAWCKKFNKIIVDLYKENFLLTEIYDFFKDTDFSIRSPNKMGNTCVSNYRIENSFSYPNLRKSTIHGVKGETHDVTMLISNPTRLGGKDSHWSYWLRNPDSEAARLAYVASSRPKHILIWCVKKLKPLEQEELKQVGFSILM